MQITSVLLLIPYKRERKKPRWRIIFGGADWILLGFSKSTVLPPNPSLSLFTLLILPWRLSPFSTGYLVNINKQSERFYPSNDVFTFSTTILLPQNHTKNTVHRLLSPWEQQRPGCIWEPDVQHQRQGRGGESSSVWSQSEYCLHHGLRIDYPHLNLMTQLSNGTTFGNGLKRRYA